MHGDFSRDSFDPSKDRTSVRHQAGRALIGDDFNEQRDIDLHEDRATNTHVIGENAGPAGDLGFEITPANGGASLQVGTGQYYVDGIRVHRREVGEVHDLPELPQDEGLYLLYLDVWEASVNAVEDPTIREVALGGPDTTVRTEVRHEVRAVRLAGNGEPACSAQFPEWNAVEAGSTGAMALWLEQGAATTDPCLVPETAGYKGPDNRFIRVEIHDGNYDPNAPGGSNGSVPTFKWAKDNGSIVASWSPPVGLSVAIDRLGPGGVEGFVPGTWVEFTNDTRNRALEAGIMAEIDSLAGNAIVLVDRPGLSAELATLHAEDDRPVARRWDSNGLTDAVPGVPIDLTDGTNSDGLQIQFAAGGVYRPGDYWTVAARTAILPGTVDRQIDWPVDDLGDPLELTAKGPRHHTARLGFASFAGLAWTVLGDCRETFAPLADLITFVGRGGDGQEAPSRHWLPRPLLVGVGHGIEPLANRDVEFRVRAGGGVLSAVRPANDGSIAVPPSAGVTVTTDAGGLARVWWRLGSAPQVDVAGDTFAQAENQVVRARLLDDSGSAAGQPVRFFARATTPRALVAAGGDGQWGWPGETLEIAPRARVSVGSRPVRGALVEFEVVTRMENGSGLNEVSGGSVHASTGAVDGEIWPGGSVAFRLVVETDAEGVAQVQWRLGTEPELPVQRLYARLLDDDRSQTGHYTIFTAHHAVADEVRWDPCPELIQFLPTVKTGHHTVQDALDLFCDLFIAGADGILRTPDGQSFPLNTSTVLSPGAFPSVQITIPGAFAAPPAVARQDLLEVSVTANTANNAIRQRILVRGDVRTRQTNRGTEITWTMNKQARRDVAAFFAANEQDEWMVLVTLRPSMLGRSQFFSDWTGGFRIGERIRTNPNQ